MRVFIASLLLLGFARGVVAGYGDGDRWGGYRIYADGGGPAWRMNQVYLDALRAIRRLNHAIAVAAENPMDDWRRRKLDAAQWDVHDKMERLEHEGRCGNMKPEDLAAAKDDLATNVEKYAGAPGDDVTPPNDLPNPPRPSEEGTAIRISETNVVVNQNFSVLSGTIPAPAPGAGVPVVLAAAAPSASPHPMALSAGKPIPDAPAAALDTRTAKNITEMDRLIDRTMGLPDRNGGADTAPVVAQAEPARNRRPQSLESIAANESARERSPASDSVSLPAKEVERRENLQGRLRLEAITAAVGTLEEGDIPGAIVSAGVGVEDFHITGDFSGGKLIAGNFGDGVAGVRVKKMPGGFTIVKLSRWELLVEYMKVVGLYTALATPLFYGCYVLGRKKLEEDPERWAA